MPFMPLWVGDFMAKTGDLDAKEAGAYLLLLMTMWGRGGTLPDDQKKLQLVARCGRDWPRVWATISRFFTAGNGVISNQRLSEELQKCAAKRIVNSQNGERGGRAKALNKKNAHLANATVSLGKSLQQPEPEPESNNNTKVSATPEMSRFTDLVLSKIGVDLSRDVTGRWSGPGPVDEVTMWREWGLSEADILATLVRKPDLSSLKYFRTAMRRVIEDRNQRRAEPKPKLSTGGGAWVPPLTPEIAAARERLLTPGGVVVNINEKRAVQ